MIRIFKDNDIKFVTQGAYNSLYKPLGYKPIIEEKKEKTVVKEPEVKEPEEVKTIEKPITHKESSKSTRRNRG